jgi:hypothetical protein
MPVNRSILSTDHRVALALLDVAPRVRRRPSYAHHRVDFARLVLVAHVLGPLVSHHPAQLDQPGRLLRTGKVLQVNQPRPVHDLISTAAAGVVVVVVVVVAGGTGTGQDGHVVVLPVDGVVDDPFEHGVEVAGVPRVPLVHVNRTARHVVELVARLAHRGALLLHEIDEIGIVDDANVVLAVVDAAPALGGVLGAPLVAVDAPVPHGPVQVVHHHQVLDVVAGVLDDLVNLRCQCGVVSSHQLRHPQVGTDGRNDRFNVVPSLARSPPPLPPSRFGGRQCGCC